MVGRGGGGGVTRQEKENLGFMSSLMRSMKRCSMSGDLTGPCLKFHALLATQPATESGQLIHIAACGGTGFTIFIETFSSR